MKNLAYARIFRSAPTLLTLAATKSSAAKTIEQPPNSWRPRYDPVRDRMTPETGAPTSKPKAEVKKLWPILESENQSMKQGGILNIAEGDEHTWCRFFEDLETT